MKFGCAVLLGILLTVGVIYFAFPNWRQEVSMDPAAKKVLDTGVAAVGEIAQTIREKAPSITKEMKVFSSDVKRFIEYNGARFTEFDMVNQSPLHQEALSQVKLKDQNVNVRRLKPQMDTALVEVVKVYWEVLGNDFVPVVTSGNDHFGHKWNSKHYRNAALDFRLKDERISKENRKLIVNKVRAKLDKRYVVLYESPGKTAEHLHVQYNGK